MTYIRLEMGRHLVYFTALVLYFVKIVTGDYVFYEDIEGSVKLNRTTTTWRNARVQCHEEGGVLASPETEELLSAMTAVMRASTSRVFTGIHDTYSKGSFHSLQGTPLAQIPARLSSESDKDRAESCLVMHQNGTLTKNICSHSLPYICNRREPSCGSKYNGYKYNSNTGSCYKVYSERITWKRAFAACAAENAHLAVINSHIEAEILSDLMKAVRNCERMHLGFSDWKEHSLWMTVDGKTLKEAGFDTWAEGEPNNYNGIQYCGGLLVRDGVLDDVSCNSDDEIYSYICEKTPDMGQKTRIMKQLELCPKTRLPLCIVC